MARSNIRERKILFLSQDNDCLSFIAEVIAKQLLPPKTQVFSAGLKGGKIHPRAVEVLREIGINVTTEEVKWLERIPADDLGLIIMLGNRVILGPSFLPVPSARLGNYLILAENQGQIWTHSATPETKLTTK